MTGSKPVSAPTTHQAILAVTLWSHHHSKSDGLHSSVENRKLPKQLVYNDFRQVTSGDAGRAFPSRERSKGSTPCASNIPPPEPGRDQARQISDDAIIEGKVRGSGRGVSRLSPVSCDDVLADRANWS